MHSERKLGPSPVVDYTIYTDASLKGWEAHDNVTIINGRWDLEEQE